MPPLIMFCLAVTDLPIEINEEKDYRHKIESDGDNGVTIKAGGDLILFKEELKESSNEPDKNLIVKIKYFEIGDRE